MILIKENLAIWKIKKSAYLKNYFMKIYTTLSEAINDLTKSGYILNFNLNDDNIECA